MFRKRNFEIVNAMQFSVSKIILVVRRTPFRYIDCFLESIPMSSTPPQLHELSFEINRRKTVYIDNKIINIPKTIEGNAKIRRADKNSTNPSVLYAYKLKFDGALFENNFEKPVDIKIAARIIIPRIEKIILSS